MADDIMFSVPEACGDNDCPVGWHIAHYWCYDDGTYSVCDSDGDHDGVDEADLPTTAQYDAAWQGYYRHVVETGQDPLGEFSVRRERKVREAWRVKLHRSILGLIAERVWRLDQDFGSSDPLPAHVAEYLTIRKTAGMGLNIVDADEDTSKQLTGGKPQRTLKFSCAVPRDPEEVCRELKAAARKAIKQ
jgi:hypothetical protein